MSDYSLDNIHDFVGQELGVSDWLKITQECVNQFAECTNDPQWIHVDKERARLESPFGTTIAHGFLTLSLTASEALSVGVTPKGVKQTINYGLDKVRFLAPVKVGARIRNRVKLASVTEKGKGLLLKTSTTTEIKGEDTPAMLAESLILLMS